MSSKTSTQDIIRWLIYALVILVPTVYNTAFDSVFTLPKLTALRVITLLIVAVWGIQIFAQGELRYRKSPLNKWLLGFGAVSALSTIFSTYFWVSFFGGQAHFLGFMTVANLLFLVMVMTTFFQDKKELQTYIKISVWTAVVLSIYGLLQFKGIAGAEGWDQDPSFRVFGTMGHSNHFGAYIAFHVMLLMGLWVNARTFSQKAIYGVGIVPMLATILATASRGAFFSLIAGGLIFGAGMAYHHRKDFYKKKKKIIALLISVLILAGIFHGPLSRRFTHLSITQRTISTIQFVLEGNVPDRVSWWLSSLAMTRDHPILGQGLATFRDVYNPYRRTDYRVPGDIQDTFSPEMAHMEYLNIVATQGVLGLGMYLGLIVCWILLLLKVMRDPEVQMTQKITALSFLSAGLVYFIQVSMSFGVIGTLVPLYLLLGASASLYHITSDTTLQSKQFKYIALNREKKLAFVLMVLIIYLFSAWFTLRQAAAEYHLQQGDQARKEGEVALMLDHYKEATTAMPWMYEYWQKYGEGAFYFGTFENNDIEIIDTLLSTSIKSYEQAYKRVQTMPSIQSNLALATMTYADILAAQGQTTKASAARDRGIALYREAIEVAVNNPLFSYTYAKLLHSMNRNDEARNAFLYVLELREIYQDTNYQLALIETEEKNYDKARAYIQAALRDDAGNENIKALQQRIYSESKL